MSIIFTLAAKPLHTRDSLQICVILEVCKCKILFTFTLKDNMISTLDLLHIIQVCKDDILSTFTFTSNAVKTKESQHIL